MEQVILTSRVRELRVARGWTQADLAEKAGYAKRTIERLEACQPVAMSTALHVAEALGVEYSDLNPQQPEGVDHGHASRDTATSTLGNHPATIELTIDNDFNDWDEGKQKALIEAIRHLLELNGEIRITRKERR